MAADLGLLSLAQRQNLYQQQHMLQKQGVWSWTGSRRSADETSPWAAVDTGGAAWPPRSYSCTFCGREFRSAQALGGHMNVHRRDRAKLHQSSSPGLAAECSLPVAAAAQLSSSIVFSSQIEAAGAGGSGVCLFYPIPTSANGVPAAAGNTLLNLLPGMAGSMRSTGDESSGKYGIRDQDGDDDMIAGEVDLELRLGW